MKKSHQHGSVWGPIKQRECRLSRGQIIHSRVPWVHREGTRRLLEFLMELITVLILTAGHWKTSPSGQSNTAVCALC